jgi:DNA-directed RNA polymerase specialized sigma24 family protein
MGVDSARAGRCTRQVATKASLIGADDAALGRLVDEHYGAMHRVARLVGRDPEQARDAVRAAWNTALRDGLPRTGTLRGGLLKLVLEALPPTPMPPTEPVGAASDLEDPKGRWSGWWKDEQERTPPADADRLDAILATIAPRLAAALVLRDVERLDPGEVEEVLGYSVAEQVALLHEGRVAVRNALRAQASR